MTLDNIKANYKPKEEYTVYAYQSKQSNNFVAVIFRKGVINVRWTKEVFEGAIKVITEQSIDKYLNALKPYMEERVKDAQSDTKLLAN